MKAIAAALAIGLAASAPAHRLDEYLQATIVSLSKDRVRASMLLMPGTAVFPRVMSRIDRNRDGLISPKEQKEYAAKVLRDLSLSVDGKPLSPKLRSIKFPKVDLIKKGLGTIELKFEALVAERSGQRRLVFENRHQAPIGAYLVNCLVPDDPNLRVVAQKRSFTQSRYELSYRSTARPSPSPST
jgi:hypothetical protein